MTHTAAADTFPLTRDRALDLLRQMWEIRAFEDKVYDLLGRDVIKGASHLYAGQEATAVGAIAALRDDDLITSTHRGHGHCHARGAALARSEDARQAHYNRMMAELFGRVTGYCKGRGGSMHIADVENGNLGATGIVGGNLPVAVGAALAQKLLGSGRVVLCFFGDGASNTGNFHESLNLAALWKLPVVFVLENNGYGMSVPIRNAAARLNLADRACAYGIPGEVVDGMDVLAVREAVGRAVERARRGEGTSLLECQTYRWYGHSRSDPRKYRSREEEAAWKARDPITTFAARLVAAGVADEAEIDALEESVRCSLEAAVAFAIQSPAPSVSELDLHVYAPFHWGEAEIAGERELREHCLEGGQGTRRISFRLAIQEALAEEMRRDPRVFLLGEDIGLAVDTDRCLLVPVLRGADGKGLVAIARETRDLVERARSGKVLPDELADGTFTITNLGMYEIDAFTPILNLPETAILGVGRIKDRAAVVDGQICVRPFLWLSLTFDHRIVDGAPAARFLQGIKQLVEEPYLLLA